MQLPDLHKIQIPDSVLKFPSMITDCEKRLLFWLARYYYSGAGLIIDAGIFLGGSTNAFATGIIENPSMHQRFGKPICSYDLALWVDSMNRYLELFATHSTLAGVSLDQGQSFEHILRALLKPHLPVVELKIGNLLKTASTDFPVEIAFYDCLKTNDRDICAFQAFAPHYIRGRTIVLQQDYFHEGAAYNKIRQEYFSDYFEYLGQVSTTAVFRLAKIIPNELITLDPVTALSIDQKIDLLKRAVARASDNKTAILTRLSIVDFLIEEHQGKLAAEHLAATEIAISGLNLDEITRRPDKIARGFRSRIKRLEC